jgi:hypothetical protein
MLWRHQIPAHTALDSEGRATEVSVIAGRLGDAQAPPPPPRSWAARAEAALAIWTIRMAPGARWTLPRAAPGVGRTLYFFRGGGLRIGEEAVPARSGVTLRPDLDVPVAAGEEEAELLLPAGPADRRAGGALRPLRDEHPRRAAAGVPRLRADALRRLAVRERRPGPPRGEGRFARHADGRVERPPG